METATEKGSEPVTEKAAAVPPTPLEMGPLLGVAEPQEEKIPAAVAEEAGETTLTAADKPGRTPAKNRRSRRRKPKKEGVADGDTAVPQKKGENVPPAETPSAVPEEPAGKEAGEISAAPASEPETRGEQQPKSAPKKPRGRPRQPPKKKEPYSKEENADKTSVSLPVKENPDEVPSGSRKKEEI